MLATLTRFVVREAPLKITALLLAIFIWYGAGTKQSVEFGMKIPLEFRNLPDNLIFVGDPPKTIRVSLRGRGRFLKFMLKGITGVVDASECEKGVFVRPLTPKDVILPAGIDAEVSEVLEPRTLRVEVRSRARKRVAVEPVLSGKPPEGFTLVGSPRASPDSVDVSGPDELVMPLARVLLEDISLSRIRGVAVHRRKVVLEGLPQVEAEPSEVEVSVTVEPIARVRFPAVAVRVEGADRGSRVSVMPSSLGVTLAGPSSAVSQLRPEELALAIEGHRLEVGTHAYRTNIVGANRIVFLPVGADSAGASAGDGAARHRTGTMALPPQLEIREITPSYFSLVVEPGTGRAAR